MQSTEPFERRSADHFDPKQAKDLTASPMNETLPSEFSPMNIKDGYPSNFFVCCFAPRRNGKTEQILHMARHFHKTKRFTHYFLVSETLSGYEEYIPANYQFTNLDNVSEIINRVQKVGKYNQGQDKEEDMVDCSVLLIMDDVVGNPADLRKRGGIVQRIAVNGRHITREDPKKSNEFCTVLISQRITLIPPPIRNNADIILASRLASYVERQTLVEQYLSLTSDREGLKEARRVFDSITLSKEYRFIAIATYIANRRSHQDYVFFQDADVKAPSVKLFGSEDDWKVKKQDIIF